MSPMPLPSKIWMPRSPRLYLIVLIGLVYIGLASCSPSATPATFIDLVNYSGDPEILAPKLASAGFERNRLGFWVNGTIEGIPVKQLDHLKDNRSISGKNRSTISAPSRYDNIQEARQFTKLMSERFVAALGGA